MCGIAGFINKNRKDVNRDIKAMCDTLEKRGPDAEGYWIEQDESIVLGHRRLSIMDLSNNGAQPMLSHDERYVISYNGEIYNFEEIRCILTERGYHSFVGTSDTEILLESFANIGIHETLENIVGMYALALYDRKERALYLIRDRMGEKPLYYGFINGNFVFASNMNSFYALDDFNLTIDKAALQIYFKRGYIPAPYSVYEGIYKLEQGCFLKIKYPYEHFRVEKYWSINSAVQMRESDKNIGSFDEASEHLEKLIKRSVQRQLVADVPVGTFLSGGIDSTLISAIAAEVSTHKIKTFTIGFFDAQHNEAEFAAETARMLGTDHTQLYISDDDARVVVPEMPFIYGEPFADSSQIPTYLVSKLARENVKVSLSGDGGDELFCGYNTYQFLPELHAKMSRIPSIIRKGAYKLSTTGLFSHSRRLQTRSEVLLAESILDCYLMLTPTKIVEKMLPCKTPISENDILEELESLIKAPQEILMLADTIRYLPDDILVKVDRSAMANSLETRVPLLDRDIVEYAWKLPLNYKKNENEGKIILKDILYRYIPKEYMDRPKHGFSIPVTSWLQGPLRGWAEDLLDENLIRKQGILNEMVVRKVWQSFLACGSYADLVWNIVVFQMWMVDREQYE